MSIQWIIVANRISTRVFKKTNAKNSLRLVKAFDNPRGRSKNTGLTSDRSGSSHGRLGRPGCHAFATNKSEHEMAAQSFVHEVSLYLDEKRKEREFDHLVIIAEPHISGEFGNCLPALTAKMVRNWVHKDLGKLTDAQLAKYFMRADVAESLAMLPD